MAKKRNTRRPKRVNSLPGSRTGENALLHRFSGWYEAHLETIDLDDDPHLSAEDSVAVITDLFEITRDVRPRGSFADPDAELLEEIFGVFDDEIDDEDELDGIVLNVVDVVQHYLEFLEDTDLWKGTEDELEECFAVLDDALEDTLDAEELAVRIRVELETDAGAVTRTLVLSSEGTLRDVHLAVQLSLAWTDAQPHRFVLAEGIGTDEDAVFAAAEDLEIFEGAIDEETTTLGDLLIDVGDTLEYIYGDDTEWLHTLTLEAIDEVDDDDELPRLVGATGTAPREDADASADESAADAAPDVAALDAALGVLRAS